MNQQLTIINRPAHLRDKLYAKTGVETSPHFDPQGNIKLHVPHLNVEREDALKSNMSQIFWKYVGKSNDNLQPDNTILHFDFIK